MAKNNTLLFGAFLFGVAYAVTRNEWYNPTSVTGDLPSNTVIATAYSTISSSKGCAFGGMNAEFGYPTAFNVPSVYYNDLYCLDFSDMDNMIWTKQTPIGDSPSPRSLASGSSFQGRFLVYGGINQYFTQFGELWEFDIESSTWSLLTPGGNSPGSRLVPTLAIDEELGLLYLEGGMTYNPDFSVTTHDDVWVYKFGESSVSALPLGWTQLRSSGASKTWIASSVFVGGVLYTIGGEDLVNPSYAEFETRVVAYDIESDIVSYPLTSDLLLRVDSVSQIRKPRDSSQTYLYGGFTGENTCRWQQRQGTTNEVVEVSLSSSTISLKSSNNLAPYGHRRHGSFVSDKDLIVFSGFGCDTSQSNDEPAPPLYYNWDQIFVYRM